MSAQTVTKKRKSTGDAVAATKKVKTAKSNEKPAPLKSALKKSKDEVALKKPKDEVALKKSKDQVAPKKPKDQIAPKKPKDEARAKKTAAPSKTAKAKVSKKTQEPLVPEDVEQEAMVEDAEEGGADLTEDQTAALLAGFSSSEDEASDDEDSGIDATKLPQAPRTQEIQKRIKEATKSNPETSPGVIYIGRIPHGFYEHQMRAYFSQFGTITHIRLGRNRKTGKSQHYGFIEFASAAVAEIVAKTMDKYLLFNHILQVRTVPQEQVNEKMFKGSGRRKKPAPRNRLEGARLRRGMVREDWDKRVERETARRAEKAEKLKELGYDFDMPGLKSTSDVAVKPKQLEDAKAGTEEGAEDEAKVLEAAVAADAPAADEPATVVTRTVQADPHSVKVTEVKVTKKRTSGESKGRKVQKAKA